MGPRGVDSGCQPDLQGMMRGTLVMGCSWRASLGLMVAGQSKESWRLEFSWASSLLVCGRKWFQLFLASPTFYVCVCVVYMCAQEGLYTGVCGGLRCFFFLKGLHPPHSLNPELTDCASHLVGGVACLPSEYCHSGWPAPPTQDARGFRRSERWSLCLLGNCLTHLDISAGPAQARLHP